MTIFDAADRGRIWPATADAIRKAAEMLRGGGLIAFPTETVYGLGADAENETAVRALFAAKGRPADHPVIVHLAEFQQVFEWAVDVPHAAEKLAAAFWPGPLTMILRRSKRASDLVTGGLETVGLRVPSHPVARQLLLEFGKAIVAPSANRFGHVSPTQAEHVQQEFGDAVAIILDGGDCEVGLESTIVDLSGEWPAILRPGAVTAEQIVAVLGPLAAPTIRSPRVSGALASHYAPQARVEVIASERLAARAQELAAVGEKVAILTPDVMSPGANITIIPLPADDAELARVLYASLRQVDRLGCDVALIALPAETGIGAAIVDRLRKAAGPRLRG